jgi:hypothetical protein
MNCLPDLIKVQGEKVLPTKDLSTVWAWGKPNQHNHGIAELIEISITVV